VKGIERKEKKTEQEEKEHSKKITDLKNNKRED
jgi:hypothetical protein